MRRFLNKHVVDNVHPPKKNEYWIADTKIKGFGLRIWRTSSGAINKAFAIRIKGLDGNYVRKTFNPNLAILKIEQEELFKSRLNTFGNSGFQRQPYFYREISLGEVTQSARLWAQDEIDKIKGRVLLGDSGARKLTFLTLNEERQTQVERLNERIKTFSFVKTKDIELKRMLNRGVSQARIDRLDSIFESYIPTKLKAKNLFEIKLSEIESLLEDIETISNQKLLRAFIGNIFDLPRKYGLYTKISSYDTREISTTYNSETHEIFKNPKRLKELFKYLENNKAYWQQAFCLRIYYDTYAPLSKVMQAKWDELHVVEYKNFYTGTPFNGILWRYGNALRSQPRLSEIALELIVKARKLAEDLDNPYLFPSTSKHHAGGHIKSVNTLWKKCIDEIGMSYISPKEFHSQYTDLRYYGIDARLGIEDSFSRDSSENTESFLCELRSNS